MEPHKQTLHLSSARRRISTTWSGAVAELPVERGSNETCFQGVSGASFTDTTVPAAGRRAVPGEGVELLRRRGFGAQSNGTPRLTGSCP